MLPCFPTGVHVTMVRNSGGRLVKVNLPQEPGAAVISNMNQMEPPPKEQQSQQPVERNPNAYRSLRDYRNPPLMSVPSSLMHYTSNKCTIWKCLQP